MNIKMMKRFKVKYSIVQEREFWVRNEEDIKSILSEQNKCHIIKIDELPLSLNPEVTKMIEQSENGE